MRGGADTITLPFAGVNALPAAFFPLLAPAPTTNAAHTRVHGRRRALPPPPSLPHARAMAAAEPPAVDAAAAADAKAKANEDFKGEGGWEESV